MNSESAMVGAIQKKLMDYPRAKHAFDKLVEVGLAPDLLSSLLQAFVLMGYTKELPQWLPSRRSLARLKKKADTLADEFENLAHYPGISFALRKHNICNADSLSNSELVGTLPTTIRRSRRVLDSVSFNSKTRCNDRNVLLCSLLCFIRLTTGNYHYPYVAVLLNAVDHASKDFQLPGLKSFVRKRGKKSSKKSNKEPGQKARHRTRKPTMGRARSLRINLSREVAYKKFRTIAQILAFPISGYHVQQAQNNRIT